MSNTASHFNLTEKQAKRVDQLWQMLLKDWPQELRDHTERTRPTCGEEVGRCIADWIKQNEAAA